MTVADEKAPMPARAWRVYGRVQGVGFRWHTVRVARGLGLVGRVWNRTDGGVEVQASGVLESLVALGDWLAVGPVAARVDLVESGVVGPESRGPGFHAVL